ncbi:family Y DNA polymerase [Candidatus Mancarchaeum acidiphilum]|uniref:DNA polymerase IV n=1 Tax=Candidatus Mancarchaeum acidiphilum TaxID=1920749 RepID=A0A218NNA4_9ARCH|nr:DNA polymerase IV [Candidatus Mancarchaeum acidiphilum]ASI13951.1 family Y DNA polymerase [Candidatus Mancarchaeum acidiphilum]
MDSKAGYVVYLDMDSFFASCEQLRHPELIGKPFAVVTDSLDKFRGVVQTASYSARKFGIHSGMPTMKALQLYPNLHCIKEDYDYYEKISNEVMEIIKSYGFKMEAVSVDEAAIDTTELNESQVLEVAKGIKTKISNELKLKCTIGIAKGKTFAKMACDSAKPNGFLFIKDYETIEFIKYKKVSDIPGVGAKTEGKLAGLNIHYIGDIQNSNVQVLVGLLGEYGSELYKLSKGIDEEKIVSDYTALSISREKNLYEDTNDIPTIMAQLKELSEDAANAVRSTQKLYKSITVKVRYYDFTTKIKTKTLSYYSDSSDVLYSEASELIKPLIKDNILVRRVGVKVSSLTDSAHQHKLF